MIYKAKNIKQRILAYAQNNGQVNSSQLVSEIGINSNTARQYLSALAKEDKLVRIEKGQYALVGKQVFTHIPSEEAQRIYTALKEKLPFTDFCLYDGSIFSPFQHHVSVNRAIYVETNRDAVDAVFSFLKDAHPNVYKHPDSDFMYDYVSLQDSCIIVKPLVTESPLADAGSLSVPTLEKILVDILKDDDFGYMQGIESLYIYQAAFDMYVINIPKLLRYARRRGAHEKVLSLIDQTKVT